MLSQVFWNICNTLKLYVTTTTQPTIPTWGAKKTRSIRRHIPTWGAKKTTRSIRFRYIPALNMIPSMSRPKRERIAELKIAESYVERRLNMMERNYNPLRVQSLRQLKNSNLQRHKLIEELTNNTYGTMLLTTSEIQSIIPKLIERKLIRDKDHFESLVILRRENDEAKEDAHREYLLERTKKELRIIKKAMKTECK